MDLGVGVRGWFFVFVFLGFFALPSPSNPAPLPRCCQGILTKGFLPPKACQGRRDADSFRVLSPQLPGA